MLRSAKNAMRSWMFIYVGLIAAIIVAVTPAERDQDRFADPAGRPVVVDVPDHVATEAPARL